MKTTAKVFIGLFTIAVLTTVGLAVFYPEDFAIALGFLVLGFAGGMLVATTLMQSYFNQGANMVHDLHKKQIINPATIMREARLQEKEDIKNQAPQPQPQPQSETQLPKFDLTGLGLDN